MIEKPRVREVLIDSLVKAWAGYLLMESRISPEEAHNRKGEIHGYYGRLRAIGESLGLEPLPPTETLMEVASERISKIRR